MGQYGLKPLILIRTCRAPGEKRKKDLPGPYIFAPSKAGE